ncbi:branched-chain amino acid ABC transporter permease [Paenibacillus sp. JMULE4]|uniref:AzlC family ABC transporter permease n=1 Tax=Paenibacillus TaxID=44249 RepID=UPI0015760D0D|nr:AzlC family ABC transporter permease [Paenibacillus sp. JMULE4]NTZ19863.1 branched-chain amino acid ABC transporter permease [Paenibacillus sp. JMULE4]
MPTHVSVIEAKGDFVQGIKDCIPTLLGYLSIGFAAGIIGKTAGLSTAEVALMSLLLYAGSAQFILAGMVAAGHSATAIIITVFFVNLRHFLLSAALSPYFRHLTPFRNMLIGSLLTDETFGVAIGQTANRKALGEKWMHGLNLAAYSNWFAANVAGAILGQWIARPEQFGLDFALPAMFIGLLVLQMLSRGTIAIDISVAVFAVIVVIGIGWMWSGSIAIIVATVAGATLGMVIERWK